MSVALRGNLRDFGIADVFQLIGQQRKTGVLEFKGDGDRAVQLRFDRGAVVSAAPVRPRAEEALGEMLVRCGRLTRQQVEAVAPEVEASAQTLPRLAVARGWLEQEDITSIEDVLTRETLFEVLRWQSGEFDFVAQPVDHDRDFEALLGAEQILMDGLRMVDEWHSFAAFVPSEDSVFQRTQGFEEYRHRTRLDAGQLGDAERVYQLVDGRIPVRRIVDLSLLGSFDAVRLLADLRRCGVIEPLDPEALQKLAPRPRRLRVDPAEAGGWLAAALSLVALAGLLWFSVARDVGVPEPAGLRLERAPRAALTDAYATQRLRHALEAYRFVTGRWPVTLDVLEQRRLLPEGSLAGAQTRPYYYAVRDGGAILLAPER